LDQLGVRYEEMTQQLSTPDAVSDSGRFQKLAATRRACGNRFEASRYKQTEKDLAGAHQMAVEADEAEMKQMAHGRGEATAERKIVRRTRPEVVAAAEGSERRTRALSWRFAPALVGDEAALFAGNSSDVFAVRGNAGLESGSARESPSSLGGMKALSRRFRE